MTFKMSDRLALSDFGSTGEVMAEERRDKSAVLDDAMMVAARRRLLASSQAREIERTQWLFGASS